MRGHVDTESLALYAEGLLSRGERARIRDHLSGCPECRAVLQQLSVVRTALHDVPAAPLPSALADRLDVALNTEVAQRAAGRSAEPAGPTAERGAAAAAGSAERGPAEPAGGTRGTGDVPGTGGSGQRPPRGPARDSRAPGRPGRRWAPRSPDPWRLLGAAAGIAVVLAGAGYGLAQLTTSTSSGSSASGAASSARTSPAQPRTPFSNGPAAALPRVVNSQQNYHRGTLGQQAAQVLAQEAGGVSAMGPVPGKHGGASPGPGFKVPSNTLLTCAAHVAHGRLVLIDQARYAGKPAYVVIFQPFGTTGRYSAVVMGPGCSAHHHPAAIARATLPPLQPTPQPTKLPIPLPTG
jgi:Putative zinc-finger